ncbi:MAG: heavy-metal-associated domain-containing protein, partial [Crocinitomicaceae bacterium]|nr:heavy-metal-associated domain-containing protein [Crocinitomicaceae bacterium]
GMTCSAGCGGKIQKELRALQGVMGTALDFSEERTDNVVSVEFDPSAVNEQQMIQCVNAIADGQYHVNSVEIVTAKKNDNPSTSDGVGVEMYDFGKVFQVLNLLQSVSRLVE